MLRVDFDEMDTQDGLTYIWKGQPFTGIAYELRPDGTLRDEIEFVDGQMHGPSRDWYESGQIESETAYYCGTPYGPDRNWDECGRLRREAFLEFGFPAREKRWDEHGRLTLDTVMGPGHPNYALLQK